MKLKTKKSKKNQIIVTMLAVMMAVAGYLNYTQKNDVKLSKTANKDKSVNATVTKKEKTTEPGEAVYTNAKVSSYIASATLKREQARSKTKESLMEIVNSKNVTEKQRNEAIDKIMKLTEMAQMEVKAEDILKADGYENVIVNISENGVDVVMDMKDVDDAMRAQVEDVVKRTSGYSIDKIVITPLSEN